MFSRENSKNFGAANFRNTNGDSNTENLMPRFFKFLLILSAISTILETDYIEKYSQGFQSKRARKLTLVFSKKPPTKINCDRFAKIAHKNHELWFTQIISSNPFNINPFNSLLLKLIYLMLTTKKYISIFMYLC